MSNRAKRRDREARLRQPADRRMAHFRLPELERIYTDRYGPVLPDDDRAGATYSSPSTTSRTWEAT